MPGQPRWIGGLALTLGVLILWLAVPRVVASTLLTLRAPVLERMAGGEQVSGAELLGLLASRELALRWVEDRETHNERGTALTSLAFQQADGAARVATIERAAAAIRAGLALAPADPKDWMQLGYLLTLRQGDINREAADAFLFSIRTGPYQAPDVLRRRLFWALAHWPLYDREERRLIAEHIRFAWEVAPGEVADLALGGPEFHIRIAAALEEAPAAHLDFLAAVAFAKPGAAPE